MSAGVITAVKALDLLKLFTRPVHALCCWLPCWRWSVRDFPQLFMIERARAEPTRRKVQCAHLHTSVVFSCTNSMAPTYTSDQLQGHYQRSW